MAIQVQGNSGVIAEVSGTTFRAINTHIKPIDYGALGHYRVSVRIASSNAQAANSRIFEIRNPHATNLIIPTRLILRALQTAAGTAQENSIDCFRVTSFTAVDTLYAATPTGSVKRTSMLAFPGNAIVRHLVSSGNASGMTGGTMTKDYNPFATLPYNVSSSVGTTMIWEMEVFGDSYGDHPFVFAQNEGMIIENRVSNITSYGITWYIDFSWAEVTAY